MISPGARSDRNACGAADYRDAPAWNSTASPVYGQRGNGVPYWGRALLPARDLERSVHSQTGVYSGTVRTPFCASKP